MTVPDESFAARIDTGSADRAVGRSLLAVVSLLAANLGLLILYVLLDLTLEQLILVFWWESLWIGLFAALKLVAASLFGDPYRNRFVDVSAGAGLLVSILAIGFVAAGFLSLFTLSGFALAFALAALSGMEPGALMFSELGLILGTSALFLASHAVSFIVNFLLLGEFRSARAGALLALPVKRCLALYVAIILAFAVAAGLPEFARTAVFTGVLVLLKMLGDYRLHCSERRELQVAEANG